MKKLSELDISPVPWEMSRGPISGGVDVVFDVIAANGAGMTSFDCCDEQFRSEEGYANARLIAAAPELYEALREVYERIADIQDEHSLSHADGEPVCDECCNAVAWVSKARAALERRGARND